MTDTDTIPALTAEWEMLKAETQGCTELSCIYHGQTVQRMRDIGRTIAQALDEAQAYTKAAT